MLYTRKGVNSVKDLIRKSIGVSAVGTLPYVLLHTGLKRLGVDISQVQVAGTGRDAERVRAMLAGITDAAVTSVEFSYLIESYPRYKVFEVFVKSLPNYLGSSIAAQNRTIRERSPQTGSEWLCQSEIHQLYAEA